MFAMEREHHPRNTLLQVPPGQKVRVKNLEADGPTRARLCALGLTPGTEVEVCMNCCGEGACRVRVREASLVLGESVAGSILCECCQAETVKDA